jgi:Flp pilus assembly pilin Flp
VRVLVHRLIDDDRGQDIVEYALLTAFFGMCAIAAWTSLREALGLHYAGTASGVQSLWDPPPPSGSPPSSP